jgi:hypothetical protein
VDDIEAGRRRWQERYDASRKRDADFTTLSGVEVQPVYGPAGPVPDFERIGWPGEFPFTRGLYPGGYRGRPWTIRQFAGFGNAQQTNERYKLILAEGGGGLSVAFDMPTLMGRDSDDPRSLGEVGHCGVAIDSAADMDVLFDGIPLGDVTTSMTISGPAVPIFCMYLVAAERQGVPIGSLDGTLQTDIFKEYIAQKEWLFEPEPHLRLIGDLMEFCAAEIPAYKPLSVSATTSGRPARPPRRSSRSPSPTGSGTSSSGCPAGWTSRRSRRAVVLLRRAHRLLRGDRQVPGGAADLGPLDARRVRREDAAGAVAAVPHPDRRGVADRAAAGQQHRPDRARGARGRARRDQLAAHQRARRGARAALGAGRPDRAAHPAGHRRGDRRRSTWPTRSAAPGTSRRSPTSSSGRPSRSSPGSGRWAATGR